MILHTVNKSPFDNTTLGSCLRLAKTGSSILLIEDGVYGALPGHPYQAELEHVMQHGKVYALEADVNARGLSGRLLPGIALVDYAGFVELTTQHHSVQSWF